MAKHLRAEWIARLRGTASERSSHAALVAGAHDRVGHRSFGAHVSSAERAASTRARAEAIRKRLGSRTLPGA